MTLPAHKSQDAHIEELMDELAAAEAKAVRGAAAEALLERMWAWQMTVQELLPDDLGEDLHLFLEKKGAGVQEDSVDAGK